jgi:hypothetical protein
MTWLSPRRSGRRLFSARCSSRVCANPAALTITLGIVLKYTVVHGLAFLVFGVAAAILFPLDSSRLEALPTDPNTAGPWIMWKGTKYAHIMVPTAAMSKAAWPAKSGSKPSTDK